MDQSLLDRLDVVSSLSSKINNYVEFLENDVTKLDVEIKSNRELSELYQKCSELFKSWLENSIEQNISSMADLATNGLNYIISDQELKFTVLQEQKYNRVSMKFRVSQDGVDGDPLASFGGGAAVVISLVLRLSVMQRLGLGNLLILDESMVALANQYVPAAGEFMRQLSEKTGINILMVTHNPEFISHAHTAYEGSKTDSLRLKKLI